MGVHLRVKRQTTKGPTQLNKTMPFGFLLFPLSLQPIFLPLSAHFNPSFFRLSLLPYPYPSFFLHGKKTLMMCTLFMS